MRLSCLLFATLTYTDIPAHTHTPQFAWWGRVFFAPDVLWRPLAVLWRQHSARSHAHAHHLHKTPTAPFLSHTFRPPSQDQWDSPRHPGVPTYTGEPHAVGSNLQSVERSPWVAQDGPGVNSTTASVFFLLFAEVTGPEWNRPRIPAATQEIFANLLRDFEATGISSVFPNGSIMGRQPWAVEFHDFFTQRNIVGIFRQSENNSQIISQRCWGRLVWGGLDQIPFHWQFWSRFFEIENCSFNVLHRSIVVVCLSFGSPMNTILSLHYDALVFLKWFEFSKSKCWTDDLVTRIKNIVDVNRFKNRLSLL